MLQSINEILNPLNKGTTADQGVDDALRHMHDIGIDAAVRLKAQGGPRGEDTAKELYDLVKSAEFRNAIGDKDFDHRHQINGRCGCRHRRHRNAADVASDEPRCQERSAGLE